MASRGPSTLPAQALPLLPPIDASQAHRSSKAVTRIQTDADLARWKTSLAHEHILLFVARLCESAVGKPTESATTQVVSHQPDAVDKVLALLDELQRWTDEIEPLKTPQRYGNLAFRTWGDRMEKRVTELHEQLLPNALHPFIAELQVYLMGSFGSWVRLDYGSGHELSFAAWLCFLSRLGFFDDEKEAEGQPAATNSGSTPPSFEPRTYESRLALRVFPKYLVVAWGVQDRYGLEPAGSHGVWGLDDYQFIPYAIGAAQLRNQTAYPPLAITSASHKPTPSPMPPSDLLRFQPSSSPMPRAAGVAAAASYPGPPFANLYTSSIARIHSLKRGPFHEHSPILHDVACTVPNWVKVHAGMMKMWMAECVDKRPVVQHFCFGGVAFPWPAAAAAAAAAVASTAAPTTIPPSTAAIGGARV